MKRVLASSLIVAVAGTLVAAEEGSSWADKISLKGDLRYRHEYIDKEGSQDRTRHRVRARVEATAQVNDVVKAGVALASGGSDPVSSNQTLDDSFSSKGIQLDKAYINWNPEAMPALDIVMGKMSNPFITVKDLLWDGDLRPEGIALQLNSKGEGMSLIGNVGGFWLDERSGTDDDAMLYGAQAAVNMSMGEASVMIGAGVFSYENLAGEATLADATDSFGNSATEVLDEMGEVIETLYVLDYMEMEAFLTVSMSAGDMPVKLYADYVVNDEADEDDAGYMLGVTLGKAKKPGQFEFDYNYRELEKDAVVGAFADSDFIGGGTDGKGHKISGKYQITDRFQCALAYFVNEIGLSGAAKDYDRLQIDIEAKF